MQGLLNCLHIIIKILQHIDASNMTYCAESILCRALGKISRWTWMPYLKLLILKIQYFACLTSINGMLKKIDLVDSSDGSH
jgi:hypothetical protein